MPKKGITSYAWRMYSDERTGVLLLLSEREAERSTQGNRVFFRQCVLVGRVPWWIYYTEPLSLFVLLGKLRLTLLFVKVFLLDEWLGGHWLIVVQPPQCADTF